MRSPISWFGGKGHMTRKLLPLLSPHHTYCEPFGGGASLLFAKPPSPVEAYNDLDGGLVHFFRTLRDPEQFDEFHRLVSLTPFAREEYNYCRATWQECDGIERAYRWFVVARMSFGGRFGAGWGSVVTESSRGMAATCSKWLSIVDLLPRIHARLMRVQIEHSDWRVVLDRYDTPETLFYLDPPYVSEMRRGGGYAHEMTVDDHQELVSILLDLRGKAILSGYAHSAYEPLEAAGWQRHDWQMSCYAAGRTRASGIQGEGAALAMQARTETVWVTPNARLQGVLF